MIWQILYPIILTSFGLVFVQAFRGKMSLVSFVQVPYCIWVTLATVLQLRITAMNWEKP